VFELEGCRGSVHACEYLKDEPGAPPRDKARRQHYGGRTAPAAVPTNFRMSVASCVVGRA
jgi:hypothetical protein